MDVPNGRTQSTSTYIFGRVAGIMRRLLRHQEPKSPESTPCPTFEAGQARWMLDQQASFYEHQLLALRYHRNTYAPISILPDEVLVEIFTLLSNARRFPKSWHQVTHVCRHWRLVALDAAHLWTTPSTSLHAYTMLYLERSRAGALDILIDDKTSESVLVPVLNEMQRVRSLVLRSRSTTFMDYVQELAQSLGHEASSLKVMDISKMIWVDWDDSVFTLPASTFGSASQLCTLKLSLINFEWQMLPLPNLTTLSLRSMKMSSDLSWKEFLQTLAEMPLLKVIDVSFRELRLHTPASLVKPIRLAHLYQLIITGATHVEMSYFLARMVLPRVRLAQINCSHGDPAPDDDYTTIIHALSSLITNGRFPVFDHINISHDEFMIMGQSDITFEFRYPGSENFSGGAGRVIGDFLSNIAHLTDSNGRSTVKSLWLDVYLDPHPAA